MNIERNASNVAMMEVYFNARGSRRKLNFVGWLPEHYMVGGHLNDGMAKMMSMAGIAQGWQDGVPKGGSDFHLIDFALAMIGAKAAEKKRRLAARERHGKA